MSRGRLIEAIFRPVTMEKQPDATSRMIWGIGVLRIGSKEVSSATTTTGVIAIDHTIYLDPYRVSV